MRRADESGAVMVMALMLVVVVGGMIAAVSQSARTSMLDTVQDRGSLVALHAAEGGLELARYRLARDAGYRGGEVEIGGTQVLVVVEARAAGGWLVRSTARCLPRGAAGLAVRHTVVAELVDGGGLPCVRRWLSSAG